MQSQLKALPLSILFVVLLFVVPDLLSERQDHALLNKAFYTGFADSVNASYLSQIDFLRTFIERRPQFSPAYFKLVERGRLANEHSRVHQFLREMTKKSASKKNALWALARMHDMEQRADSSFSAYSLALEQGITSFLFYENFLNFDLRHEKAFHVLEKIKQSQAPEQAKQFSIAFQHYLDGDPG